MLNWYVRIAAATLFILGLVGFIFGQVPHLAQFDLFQSFTYAIFGAIGLKLGWGAASAKARARYALATGIFGYALLALGLTFPNWADIFHLEPTEDVLHGLLGLVGSFVGEHYLKHS